MVKLKVSLLFAAAVVLGPWGTIQAHLCDNVFRQADKLIVKPEAYNLVVKDKLAFKIFLQNNMDRGIAEISLIGDSSAFDITANPRKMSIPKDQRAFFEVNLVPKPETKTGNYPVNFRLVGGGKLFKSFSINAGGQANAGAAPGQAAASNAEMLQVSSLISGEQSAQAKPSGSLTHVDLDRSAARSSPPETAATPARLPSQASGKTGVGEPLAGQGENRTNRPPAEAMDENAGDALKGAAGPTLKQPDRPVKPKHVLEIRTASVVPEIDGVITEPAWKSAAVLANFTAVGGGQAVYDTTGLLVRDSGNLYVGIYCNDENTEALTDQDSLEIQLAKIAAGRPAYSLIVSPSDKVSLKQILPDDRTIVWPASGIRYVIGKENRSWSAEVVIPFSALNVPSAAVPPRWYLRVIRTKASGNAEKSYWAPDASGYNSEKGFGTIQLAP